MQIICKYILFWRNRYLFIIFSRGYMGVCIPHEYE